MEHETGNIYEITPLILHHRYMMKYYLVALDLAIGSRHFKGYSSKMLIYLFSSGHQGEWYRGDLKSNHLKSGNILNPDFLKVKFQMVWFSNGQALAMAKAFVC